MAQKNKADPKKLAGLRSAVQQQQQRAKAAQAKVDAEIAAGTRPVEGEGLKTTKNKMQKKLANPPKNPENGEAINQIVRDGGKTEAAATPHDADYYRALHFGIVDHIIEIVKNIRDEINLQIKTEKQFTPTDWENYENRIKQSIEMLLKRNELFTAEANNINGAFEAAILKEINELKKDPNNKKMIDLLRKSGIEAFITQTDEFASFVNKQIEKYGIEGLGHLYQAEVNDAEGIASNRQRNESIEQIREQIEQLRAELEANRVAPLRLGKGTGVSIGVQPENTAEGKKQAERSPQTVTFDEVVGAVRLLCGQIPQIENNGQQKGGKSKTKWKDVLDGEHLVLDGKKVLIPTWAQVPGILKALKSKLNGVESPLSQYIDNLIEVAGRVASRKNNPNIRQDKDELIALAKQGLSNGVKSEAKNTEYINSELVDSTSNGTEYNSTSVTTNLTERDWIKLDKERQKIYKQIRKLERKDFGITLSVVKGHSGAKITKLRERLAELDKVLGPADLKTGKSVRPIKFADSENNAVAAKKPKQNRLATLLASLSLIDRGIEKKESKKAEKSTESKRSIKPQTESIGKKELEALKSRYDGAEKMVSNAEKAEKQKLVTPAPEAVAATEPVERAADADGLAERKETATDKLYKLIQNKFGRKSDSGETEGIDLSGFDWRGISDKKGLAKALGVKPRDIGDDVFNEFSEIKQDPKVRIPNLPNPSVAPMFQQPMPDQFLTELERRRSESAQAQTTAAATSAPTAESANGGLGSVRMEDNDFTTGEQWTYDANGNPVFIGIGQTRNQGPIDETPLRAGQTRSAANGGNVPPTADVSDETVGTQNAQQANGNAGGTPTPVVTEAPVQPEQQGAAPVQQSATATSAQTPGQQPTAQARQGAPVSQQQGQGSAVAAAQQHQTQGPGVQNDTPHDVRALIDILPIVGGEGSYQMYLQGGPAGNINSFEQNLVKIAANSPRGGQEYATNVKDSLFTGASAQYDSYCDPDGKKTGWIEKTTYALQGIDGLKSLKPKFYERFASNMATCVEFLIDNIKNGRELNQYDYVTIAHLQIMNGSGSQKFMEAFKAELSGREIDLSVLDQVRQKSPQEIAVEQMQMGIGIAVDSKNQEQAQTATASAQQSTQEVSEQLTEQNQQSQINQTLKDIFGEVISEPKIGGKPATERAKGNPERKFETAEDAYKAYMEAATRNAEVVELAKAAEQARAEGKEVTLTAKQTRGIAQQWSTLADVRRHLADEEFRYQFVQQVLDEKNQLPKDATPEQIQARKEILSIIGGLYDKKLITDEGLADFAAREVVINRNHVVACKTQYDQQRQAANAANGAPAADSGSPKTGTPPKAGAGH